MAKNLVIVESPAKAKTLKKFLGSSYKIEASVGHVRDLPKSQLGIDVDKDYEPRYITIRGKGEVLSKLRKEVKAADKVYLATDPDREGEAISWHLMQALRLDEKSASRITFNEITKNAVKKSIKEAREIDMNLVDAQQARRELDRIVGYKLSPLLWKKVKKGLSAGRVQSATLKLICDREEEVDCFIPEEYWSLEAELKSSNGLLRAKLHTHKDAKTELKSKEDCQQVMDAVKDEEFVTDEVKKGLRSKKPSPPFTTSTLQQEASKLLGFATRKTMSVAQQLYEGVDVKDKGTLGLVTYIRTDSTRIADEAFEDASSYIKDNFGPAYAAAEKPTYKIRERAQDAHEAIRPSYTDLSPEILKDSLPRDHYRLYKLIWERFVASLMVPAEYDTLSVKIKAGEYGFRASGSILRFDGYLAAYKKNEDKEEDTKIPVLQEKEKLKLVKLDPAQHFTQAPPRYTEAMLVKSMEELGIGRPSTYSATISNITQRYYVIKENKMFYVTELGKIVNEIMKTNFGDIVDIDFTAKMEEDLDRIEEGKLEWKEVIRQFYPSLEEKIREAEKAIGEIEVEDPRTDVICEKCGRNMVIKYGRFGKFLACPGFPDCRNAKPLYEDAEVECPLCASKVLIKKTKKGRVYYGCENNPNCGFLSWNKPAGEKCPVCGEFLVIKGSKKPKIACSNSQCGFSKEMDDNRDI